MIYDAFRRQVAKRPDAVAVHDLTYRELAVRADRLAGRLWEAGVRPGDVVGVYLPRSTSVVIALLAVLRLGAAYLALDHRDPAERRRTILTDAATRTVLTTPEWAAALPHDQDRLFVADESTSDPPAVAVPPEQVAYVAYTSGSTGRPKGVRVPHRAVARLVLDADYLRIGPDDVFLQYAPVAFDASTLEIWGPLLNGARLVVPPHDLPPTSLGAVVRQEGVTVLWLTAGLFHEMVDAGLADLGGLRYLLAGGDALSVPHVNRALAALPDTVLVNGYGPTENTTFTCCHHIIEPVHGTTVPIGTPIAGSTAYVLDHRLRPVGPGQTGELYTGGRGVAHGYLGDPALTAGRFVSDPSGPAGARMYRTGDVVRRQTDGVLDFVGRADRQVKIRGFRVETAEVESAIAALPGVTAAAVVVQHGPAGDRRLAAFVVGGTSSLEIRLRLADVLPEYAVPAFIALRDGLPLTPNGKVDRPELESLVTQARPVLTSDHRPPGTAVERAVAQQWTDLLGIDGIGADDDFFELGGHSLLGVRILGDLRRRYGVELSPLTFYLDPTPAGLARALVEQGAKGEAR
jgi:amino acid adenylation domain-containing protein